MWETHGNHMGPMWVPYNQAKKLVKKKILMLNFFADDENRTRDPWHGSWAL